MKVKYLFLAMDYNLAVFSAGKEVMTLVSNHIQIRPCSPMTPYAV